MKYQFDSGSIGRCQVELRAAGKHGFAVPKIFEITCLQSPAKPVYTFGFTDNLVIGMTPREFTNATLCRIVIAQFLLFIACDHDGTTQALDTSIPPFEGPVMNPEGMSLTFFPGCMRRAVQCVRPSMQTRRRSQARRRTTTKTPIAPLAITHLYWTSTSYANALASTPLSRGACSIAAIAPAVCAVAAGIAAAFAAGAAPPRSAP